MSSLNVNSILPRDTSLIGNRQNPLALIHSRSVRKAGWNTSVSTMQDELELPLSYSFKASSQGEAKRFTDERSLPQNQTSILLASPKNININATNTKERKTPAATKTHHNLLQHAIDIGAIGETATTKVASLSQNRNSKLYRFTLKKLRNFSLNFSGLSQSATIRLIQDKNNNDQVNLDEVLASGTSLFGLNNVVLTKNLLPGSYFVQLYSESTGTPYRLRLWANQPKVLINTQAFFDQSVPGISWDNYNLTVNIDGKHWSSSDFRSFKFGQVQAGFPDWRYIKNVSKRVVPIQIGLYRGYDWKDINPASSIKDLNLTYDIITNKVKGDITGTGGKLFTSQGSDLDDKASINFLVDTGDWYHLWLRDKKLQSLSRSLAGDGRLDRRDMIAILRKAESKNIIDNSEFQDLRTLVSRRESLMPEYVHHLSYKVVFENYANTAWSFGSNPPKGNLQAGSSADVMEHLIGKWFLGTDHPAADPKTTYQWVNGALVKDDFQYTDIDQGGLGDCYFLASLAGAAHQMKSVVKNMFIDNGDGTYTVRFYNAHKADYFTVDRYLPVVANGNSFYANWGGAYNDANNELWVALAEKAYVSFRDSSNEYEDIAGGSPAAIRHITGLDSTGKCLLQYPALPPIFSTPSFSDFFEKPDPQEQQYDAKMFSGIVNAYKSKHIVYFSSGDHAYTLVGVNGGVDPATTTFLVYNPWGYHEAPLSWQGMKDKFFTWAESK